MVNDLWVNLFKKTNKDDHHLSVLRKNILFETLDNSELHFVIKTIHERNYHPGEVIFQQDSLGTGMYVIVKGSVDIFIKEVDPRKQGVIQNVHVAHLIEEDFFGEMSLVEEDSRRTATAVAAENTTLMGFFRPDLQQIVNRNPTIGGKITFQLAKILLRRLQATTNKIADLKKELKVLASFQKK